MSRRIVPIIWLMLAAVIIGASVGLAVRAGAEPDTFERECQTFYGNPDGSWCTWTNPANGKRYLVGSNDYWQHGSPLGGGAHF